MIPPNAQRAYEGEIFDIYRWDQELYDGTSAVFERAKRKADTVQVIAVTNGRIILLDEEQPDTKRTASLPGGRVEIGEEPIETARRELFEETGYEASEIHEWKTYDRFPKLEWSVHYFIATGCEKTHEPTPDAGEKIAVSVVSFEEFHDLVTLPDRDDGAFTADMLRLKLDAEALEEFKRILYS